MNDLIEIRWQQRFANFKLAYQKLQHAVEVNEKSDDELYRMALIKAFEMTFELSWKTMKDYLKENGIDASFPKEVLKESFANGIIEDGELWIEMLQDRNLMTHTYDDVRARLARDHICQRYIVGIDQLHHYLEQRIV